MPLGLDNAMYSVAEHVLSRVLPDLRCEDPCKGVPVPAGLGGSGATAAAVAYPFKGLCGLNLSIEELLGITTEGLYLVAVTSMQSVPGAGYHSLQTVKMASNSIPYIRGRRTRRERRQRK